jgi:hypothetical protein
VYCLHHQGCEGGGIMSVHENITLMMEAVHSSETRSPSSRRHSAMCQKAVIFMTGYSYILVAIWYWQIQIHQILMVICTFWYWLTLMWRFCCGTLVIRHET